MRLTYVNIVVSDLDAERRRLTEKGMRFPMPPTLQPWGKERALMAVPDGTVHDVEQAP